MPPGAPWPNSRSTVFADEQIVSALGLKLRTLKQDGMIIGVSTLHSPESPPPARRSHALAWLCGVKQEKEE